MSQAVAAEVAAPAHELPSTKTFLGHPVGLYVLFFTEMWERFSYYGMRALLVLYMTKYLFIDGHYQGVVGYTVIKGALEAVFGPLAVQPLSSQIYGLYTGLVYFTPFFGGILADQLLGQRKTVVLGGVLMAIGHFLMAVESLFFVALFFLILGNGCFKPNISTQVGGLYAPGDSRRDRAFGIFYMGINLGAFLAPLVCGTLGQSESFGWHWGFGAAGVGMCLGLVIYLIGQPVLAKDNVMKRKESANVEKQPLTPEEKKRVLALVILCALNIVFWAVYEQQGNTMQLWATDQTNWPTIFGWTIPNTWFQAFNPMMIFLFTPLLALFWGWQAKSGKEPSSVAKMAIGCSILGLSFVVMVVGALLLGSNKGSLFWPLFCTFMLTIGELYLSPIGLSLVTKVAPPRIVSMMMGMWFFSSFFGNYLSGFIGSFYSRMPGGKPAFFLMLTILGLAAGLGIWIMNKPIQRWMRSGATADAKL
ncbi:MAG: peptide MFS transporter [Myxococcaceae bacterium]|nr:peptide MFS transporter [Myxococcaceae bacterium]